MRVLLILGGVLLLPAAPAAAQSSAQAAAAFNKCGGITNDSERLACFDKALRETSAQHREDVAAQRAVRTKRQREEFGLDAVAVEKREREADPTTPPSLRTVKAQVVSADVDPIGYWTIQLADGAMWRQTELIRTFQPPERGDTVTIRKGPMGGYLLEFGSQQASRVQRIR